VHLNSEPCAVIETERVTVLRHEASYDTGKYVSTAANGKRVIAMRADPCARPIRNDRSMTLQYNNAAKALGQSLRRCRASIGINRIGVQLQRFGKPSKFTRVRSHDDGRTQIKVKSRSGSKAIERIGIDNHWSPVILREHSNDHLTFGETGAKSRSDHNDIRTTSVGVNRGSHSMRHKVVIAINGKRKPRSGWIRCKDCRQQRLRSRRDTKRRTCA
jgi:hypothetical protein